MHHSRMFGIALSNKLHKSHLEVPNLGPPWHSPIITVQRCLSHGVFRKIHVNLLSWQIPNPTYQILKREWLSDLPMKEIVLQRSSFAWVLAKCFFLSLTNPSAIFGSKSDVWDSEYAMKAGYIRSYSS